jgi:solute carrier family 10 (sodium/bile acid cotransporter), member 7
MIQFLIRRWFLLGLAGVLGTGLFLAAPLTPLVRGSALRQTVMVVVMFLMALPLPTSALWATLRSPRAPLLGTVVNYGFLPLLAWGLAVGLPLNDDIRFGLMVAATTPCTLASAAVWTQRAGGNDAVAIVIMIVTNLLCFILTPAWLQVMLGQMPRFDFASMVVQLICYAVLPIVVAQVVRQIRTLGNWASRQKRLVSTVVQIGVLCLVFFGAIQTGNRLAGSSFASLWRDVLLMVVAAVATHLLALYTGWRLARGWRLPEPDAIAVGLAGSQKTLTVGLEVCAQLGVSVLPMVAYHVGQLLLDTVWIERRLK